MWKKWNMLPMTVPQVMLFFLLLSSSLRAQEVSPMQQCLSLDVHHERLDSVFSRLTVLTGLSFAFSPDRIDITQRVTVNIKERPLQEVLDKLSREGGFRYLLSAGKVLIVPREDTPAIQGKSSYFVVSGYVTDRSSRERLPYAGIRLMYKDRNAGANSYGFFSLSLPAGHHTLIFSYVGYTPW